MRTIFRWKNVWKYRCLIVVIAFLATLPMSLSTFLNFLGPSTEYYDPVVPTAVKECDDLENGDRKCKDVVYVGDDTYVSYYIVRHQINGNCLLDVDRFAEEMSGPRKGLIHLLDQAELQFVGKNELRRPRWPSPPKQMHLGYDSLGEPILLAGESEVDLDLYVVARYYCNVMDYLIPRYIQGGPVPNQTERVRVTLRRR